MSENYQEIESALPKFLDVANDLEKKDKTSRMFSTTSDDDNKIKMMFVG